MARKEINIFSVSLLDLLSGALGAVIILYILIPRLTEEEIELLDDVKVLQEQTQSIEEILDDLENSIPIEVFEKIEDKMNTLREEVQHLKENLEVLAGKVENLQKQLAECEQKKKELEGKIMELESKVADLEKQLAEKIEELNREKAKNEKLTTDNKGLRDENSSMKSEISELETKNGSLESEISTMQKTDALADNLDLVIVMDLTGSLKDEIADLKENVSSLVEILQKTVVSLRIGFVAYRDTRDNYEEDSYEKIAGNYSFKSYPLSNVNLSSFKSFVNNLQAQGGGDSPEAVEIGLKQAISMNWRMEDSKKIIVVIGDAPPHSIDISNCYTMASSFSTRGPASKVSSISAGGGEDFFKSLSYRGKGDYVENQGKMLSSILLSIMD